MQFEFPLYLGMTVALISGPTQLFLNLLCIIIAVNLSEDSNSTLTIKVYKDLVITTSALYTEYKKLLSWLLLLVSMVSWEP